MKETFDPATGFTYLDAEDLPEAPAVPAQPSPSDLLYQDLKNRSREQWREVLADDEKLRTRYVEALLVEAGEGRKPKGHIEELWNAAGCLNISEAQIVRDVEIVQEALILQTLHNDLERATVTEQAAIAAYAEAEAACRVKMSAAKTERSKAHDAYRDCASARGKLQMLEHQRPTLFTVGEDGCPRLLS